MLRISQDMMDKMAEVAFFKRLIGAIAEYDPEATRDLNSPEGQRIMREQYGKAHTYGLSTELELGQYIITAWMLGTDFDTKYPAMHEILTHPTMSPSQKAEAIEQVTLMLFERLQAGAKQ